MAARNQGREGNGVSAHGWEVSFWDDGNVLELDSGWLHNNVNAVHSFTKTPRWYTLGW